VSRWTGHPEIAAVLTAAQKWRDRCLLADGSMFTELPLWTADNLRDIQQRFEGNPIVGSSRDFLQKLEIQLKGADSAVIQLAAEVIWFLFLFPSPSSMKADTKRGSVQTVWSWSGEQLSADLSGLDDETLTGVGHPGTAYLTHRPAEFGYVLRVVIAFKGLPQAEQSRILLADTPWEFGEWLDKQAGSDRRLARNVFLYFLFPDYIERNTSRQHRQQIYEAFKNRLPQNQRVRGKRTLLDYDKAIYAIRQELEKERGSKEFDFYLDDVKSTWFSAYRDNRRKEFIAWLDTFLQNRGLKLNQSGRDTTMEKLLNNDAIASNTGFWAEDKGLTAKPPRWLIHLDISGPKPVASVPDRHRSGAIGFANTQGGDSGAFAARIVVLAKVGSSYHLIENWEWQLLFCFPQSLKPGSAAQTFDDFNPATGALTYMNETVPYISSALLALNEPDERYSIEVGGQKRILEYRDVTEALANLIHVEVPNG
jgi:hypothetical protein